MQKIEKRKIIYISIIITIALIGYFFITKEEQYIEKNFNVQFNEGTSNQEIANDLVKGDINKIVIYVTGAVNKQGVYEIEEGSRIADVIEIAGGVTENANIQNINLAYIVQDGMKIHIPEINENANLVQDNTESYITRDNEGSENFNSTNSTNNNKININTATQSELETLPGIGPATALKIIEYRKKNGKFKDITDIKNVSGIGESKFSQMKDYIEI